ncbi:hypothetical protein ACJMK2_032155 [Sinanodonta woodiana]|uniref:Uncharacterized protein n=1 Tax=Sinanodonta woodiana TaxID=1069815 RepID=A0ABD3X4G5_SINWO
MAKVMVIIALLIISLVGLTHGTGYSYAGAYPVIAGVYGGKGVVGGYGGAGFGGGYGGCGFGGTLQCIFPLILLVIFLSFITNLFRTGR